MSEKVVKRRLLVLFLLTITAVVVWWPELSIGRFSSKVCNPDLLCVVFLNVGQGDSIFIQSPTGTQMLIDGGRDATVLRELGKVMSFKDRDLDYILATHPDADHVTGLKFVLERFTVANIVRTENESKTAIWQAVEENINDESADVHIARRGQVYDLGGGVKLNVLFPDIDPRELESNTSSIVARLTYGDSEFMLTGDAPKAIEEYLVLLDDRDLQSDVLKAGHHGSRTSTSELFLSAVDPSYAVISAGQDNSYGHPHLEVTDMLFNHRVKTINTAEHGRVTFWSDGRTVWLPE